MDQCSGHSNIVALLESNNKKLDEVLSVLTTGLDGHPGMIQRVYTIEKLVRDHECVISKAKKAIFAMMCTSAANIGAFAFWLAKIYLER